MEFQGYQRLTDEEREAAIEYAERRGVPPTEVMRRVAGYGRIFPDNTGDM